MSGEMIAGVGHMVGSMRQGISHIARGGWLLWFLGLLMCGSVVLADGAATPAAPPDPLAPAQALVTGKKYTEALSALGTFLKEVHPQAQVEAAQLLEATCYSGLGKDQQAIDLLWDLAQKGTDANRLTAAQTLAEMDLAKGDTVRAMLALQIAAEVYPRVQEENLEAAKQPQYYGNRVEYDTAAQYAFSQMLRIAAAQDQAGNASDATLTYRRAYLSYPEYPEAQSVALGLGGRFLSAGNWSGALAYYLEVLDTGNDRCFEPTAALGENQRYLNQVARPPAREIIHSALVGFNECLKTGKVGKALSDADLAAFEAGWYAALTSTFQPETASGAAQWMTLLNAQTEPAYQDLVRLALGQGLLREGRYEEALEVLQQTTARKDALPEIAARATYLSARAQMGLCEFRKADEMLRDLRGSGTETVRGWSDETRLLLSSRLLFTLGECNEQRGKLDLAEGYYHLAAQENPSVWTKRRAEYGLTRVAALRRAPAAFGESVAVLPDDRTTRGYWPVGYGRLSYALLAQNFVVDRDGGAGPALSYSFCTTDPKEPSRLWVSQKQDDDPAAMWDPANKLFRSASRDDHGEQVPVGQGPDLLVSVQVPAGVYTLSLYFANDHNFYEPNRRFTVSVTDDKGHLQAVTTVEDFAGGVYKRFVVKGGTTYLFHIWRNLSMNTLVSGIFLDPRPALQPVPYPKIEKTPPALVGVAGTYQSIVEDMASAPLDTWYTQPRTMSLIGRLQGMVGRSLLGTSWETLSGTDEAAVWWMLSECYRLSAQAVRGEAAFDQYLSTLEKVGGSDEQVVKTCRAVANGLCAADNTGDARVEALHRLVFQGGDDRLDRVWSAYLSAVQRAYAADVKKREDALVELVSSADAAVTPFAKGQAFAALQKDFPQAASQPRVLMAAGLAAKSEGNTAAAQQLVEQALAGKPAATDRPLLLANLLTLQVNTKVPPDQVKTTYEQLVACAQDKRYAPLARSGLLQVAEAYRLAGQKAQALGTLKEYQTKYGNDPMVQGLLAMCAK